MKRHKRGTPYRSDVQLASKSLPTLILRVVASFKTHKLLSKHNMQMKGATCCMLKAAQRIVQCARGSMASCTRTCMSELVRT